jgi:hypothetical protein
MRFLVDQNIPVSVASVLLDRGFDTQHVRHVLRPDSPDQLIAYLAIQENFIILTHDKDFRNINALTPHGYRKRLKMADRVILGPTSIHAAPRMAQVLDLVISMHQWAVSTRSQFRVDITAISIRLVDRVVPTTAFETSIASI